MIGLHQIEVFCALMKSGTVTAAADVMHISQPALSRIVRRMEDRIGFQLFARVKGRLVPTPEAHALFADVEIIHKKVTDLNLTIDRLARGEEVIFRFGASPSLGNSVAPIALRDLRNRYPALVVRTDIVPIDELLDYLTLRKGELLLTLFPIKHPMIHNQRIGVGRMVCALPKSHPLAARERIAAKDIADEEIIGFEPGSTHGNAIRMIERTAGISFRFKTFVRFAETAIALAEQGLGVALVDEFTAMGARRLSETTLPLVEEVPFTLYANCHQFNPLSSYGKEFLRALRRIVPQSL